MTKKLFLILSAVTIVTLVHPASISAAPCVSHNVPVSTQVSPQSDDIRYVYKIINGYTFKRLYNYTTGEWIGAWIWVL